MPNKVSLKPFDFVRRNRQLSSISPFWVFNLLLRQQKLHYHPAPTFDFPPELSDHEAEGYSNMFTTLKKMVKGLDSRTKVMDIKQCPHWSHWYIKTRCNLTGIWNMECGMISTISKHVNHYYFLLLFFKNEIKRPKIHRGLFECCVQLHCKATRYC